MVIVIPFQSVVNVAHEMSEQAIASLLSSATNPMYLARGLMSNLPNRDTKVARSLAGILGFPHTESPPYGPFVPESLMPHTYGFKFDLDGRESKG